MQLPSSILFLGILAHYITAQSLEGFQVRYPDISDACADALNTTLSACPPFLGTASVDNPRLNSEQLSQLCTSACHSNLTSVRKTIAGACEKTDIISYDGQDWPATLIIDRYIYTYDLSCRKDSSSGKFCDEIFVSFLNQSRLTAAQNCSDCMLGVVQIQLNSPFGYDDEFAEDFKSATSSCSATKYPFTSPPPYALNPTTTASPVPTYTPTCSSPYQVKANDTCNSISLTHNVSTLGIVNAGGLSPSCSNLQAVGSLCLPAPCPLYLVDYDDTCDSIITAHCGLGCSDLLVWNPNINIICSNIQNLADTYICVGPPGGYSPPTNATSSRPVPTQKTPVPKPTNAPPESNACCGKWYVVQKGDDCNQISVKQSISLEDFYFLNPEINKSCSNLKLGLAYCVQAVGAITTYPGFPTTSEAYTLPPITYITTTYTLPSAPPLSTTPIVPLPTASGTVPNCQAYVDYVPIPDLAEQVESDTAAVLTNDINSCDYVLSAYSVPPEAFLSWNPSLASVNPCALQPGFSYCASNGTSYDSGKQNNTQCLPADHGYPGTIASCSCFTIVHGYDRSSYLCKDITDDTRISLKQLTSWNPWVGTDCDKGLYADLNDGDQRPVCIGVDSTAKDTAALALSDLSQNLDSFV